MTCPLFVELCAGTAAVSLRLHRDGARPPVSRMGAKTGYASTILRVLGLIPGQGAAAYLWCEPDPGVRLLLEAYRDAALARDAAAIIRGWAAEEPRALWERLRAEGPPRGPSADEVARWAFVSGGSMMGDGSGIFAGNLIGWKGTDHGQGSKRPLVERLPDALGVLPTLPATITPDARAVDPREVARWAWVVGHMTPIEAHRVLPAGAVRGGALAGQYNPKYAHTGWCIPHSVWLSDRLDATPTLPATIHPDARDIDPGPALPPGTVVYADPPYVGTTGYAADLPRAEVVALARRWAEAGATVCISEAEPIADLVADGWYQVRIDGERTGQKRTFSRQQAEWLTMNRPPAWRPSVQGALFGGV